MTATTHRHGTKTCRDCGAPFARSAQDFTVRCPDCRGGGSARRSDTCVVCDGAGTCTYGPSATDGSFTTVTCHRCGGTGRRPA